MKLEIKCKYCGSNKLHRKAIQGNWKRLRCDDCHKWDRIPLEHLSETHPQIPKMLLIDIETSPMEVYVWGLIGNKYIQPNNIIKDWNMISWAAKWIFDSNMMSAIQTPKEAKARDDERITKSIWKLFDEADIIIAQNGRKFDFKKLNTRFYTHGLMSPSPYQTIDTLIEARKHFAFSSNKLDYLGQLMVGKKKLETNFKLWTDCLNGDKSQLDRMLAYNEEDVYLLEEVYLELRPWIKSHPNVALLMDGNSNACPTCNSNDLSETGTYYTTQANQYLSLRCNSCGSLSREMKGEIPLKDRRKLVRTVAR
jgi:RNase P subunit RPR2